MNTSLGYCVMEMKRAPNVKVAENRNIKQDPDGKR